MHSRKRKSQAPHEERAHLDTSGTSHKLTTATARTKRPASAQREHVAPPSKKAKRQQRPTQQHTTAASAAAPAEVPSRVAASSVRRTKTKGGRQSRQRGVGATAEAAPRGRRTAPSEPDVEGNAAEQSPPCGSDRTVEVVLDDDAHQINRAAEGEFLDFWHAAGQRDLPVLFGAEPSLARLMAATTNLGQLLQHLAESAGQTQLSLKIRDELRWTDLGYNFGEADVEYYMTEVLQADAGRSITVRQFKFVVCESCRFWIGCSVFLMTFSGFF